MAKRHLLSEPKVQVVVDGLVTHLRRLGSVNALAEQLSSASGQKIYPNRIHGLLAEDASRTVTAATLEALCRGLAELADADGPDAAAFADLDDRVAAVAATIPAGTDLVGSVAATIDLPPAVVRRSLPAAMELGEAVSETTAGQPDWSWQETAVDRVREALSRPTDNRVGLIVPTGGGKTRLGLRAILQNLSSDPRQDSIAIWVTHRRRLQRQARRSLQELIRDGRQAPPEASALFERIHFVMIGDLDAALTSTPVAVNLIVVDEAHHAAAPSYAPIFETAVPALFLTATPVRADRLPIGIDRVAYTITYTELFKRNCVIEPIFDPSLDLPGLDWSTPAGLTELADYLLDRAEQDFSKVLVAVSQQERAERLYTAVVELLEERSGHPLTTDDVAYVHGGSNSYGVADASDALDENAGKPAGILIATAALVGEGYDDPSIDAAIVTYPSTSIGHLMQVAGRALRWAPGKRRAHVVQVRESPLQYYFDQRWLYQEISDELRPELLDLEYSSIEQLQSIVEGLLQEHHVSAARASRVKDQLRAIAAGADVRLMFGGINYYGVASDFQQVAPWTAILADDPEWSRFLNIFNDLSLRSEDIKEPQQYLQAHLSPDSSAGSLWKSYMDLLNATEYARRELNSHSYPGAQSRPYRPGSSTSWLRYVTLRYQPVVPEALDSFLSDAVNRDELLAAFGARPHAWTGAVKVRLPLTGSVAALVNPAQAHWLASAREDLVRQLRTASLTDGFPVLTSWRSAQVAVPVPQVMIEHVEQFAPAIGWEAQHLELSPWVPEPTHASMSVDP